MHSLTINAELKLSELDESDAPILYKLVQKNRTHLARLGDYNDLVDLPETGIQDHLEIDPNQIKFGIYLKRTLIGTVSLITYRPNIFGLGYWIDFDQATKGYTTEAVRAVVDFARQRQNAREIWAGVSPKNEASIRLVQRLGFKLARTQETHLSYCLTVPVSDGI